MAEASGSAELADAALVVVGHGSALNPDSSRPTRDHAADIRRRGIFAEVHTAFWKEEPFIGRILDKIAAPRVFVVPNLACKGYITGEVMPKEMGLTGPETRRGDQRIYLCDPVGTHPVIAATIARRAGGIVITHGLDTADTCLLLIGHGSPRNKQSSIQTRLVADTLAGQGVAAETRTAFLEHGPRVEDWARVTAAANVIVVPFMISNGLHGAEDVPALLGLSPAVKDLKRMAEDGTPAGPYDVQGRKMWYCRAVGSEPEVAGIIVEQVLAFGRLG
jgi:sirohydrochlorin cobaltochelatase